ncbi:PilN domain-containing protein [Pseudomonas aegrilactucae]|uniref:PilN domain-containing protein n=1 Tax=Pseudomonas aegrilactucae TaxID=2854028 RepID=A0A9Q2XMW7_9PSED|nr:PilN domain-containing protein [Pseudomonas aegrilactucae]MBV6289094.1 PilN domain-containing protein [Pseudomonas aegrilactucae]
MRRLALDFQPRRRGPLAWVPAVLGTASLVAVVVLQQHLGQTQARLQQQVQQAEQQLGVRPRSQPGLTPAQSREQAESLAQMRSVSQQLQRPWERLFAMLEALPQDDVALLVLSPDARKGQLRISAEARDLEAMLAFHKRLEASAQLSDVSLLNHEIQAKQPEHPVQFNLSASWESGDAHF